MSDIRKVINYRERQGTYRATLDGLSASACSGPELAATAVMRKWLARYYGDPATYDVVAKGTCAGIGSGSVLVVATAASTRAVPSAPDDAMSPAEAWQRRIDSIEAAGQTRLIP